MRRVLLHMIAALAVVLTASMAAAQVHPDDIYWASPSFNPGANSRVEAIAIDGSDVYVGGHFNFIDNENIIGVARWDGTDWHALGAGSPSTVELLVYDGVVYAASSTLLRAWDGLSWRTVGRVEGIHFIPALESIAEFKGDIYISGGFERVGATTVNSIARYDGTWHSLDGGLENAWSEWGGSAVIAADSDYLYVVGAFT